MKHSFIRMAWSTLKTAKDLSERNTEHDNALVGVMISDTVRYLLQQMLVDQNIMYTSEQSISDLFNLLQEKRFYGSPALQLAGPGLMKTLDEYSSKLRTDCSFRVSDQSMASTLTFVEKFYTRVWVVREEYIADLIYKDVTLRGSCGGQ